MPQSTPASLRQSFELPGGRIAVFKFAAPDQLSTEITPSPERIASRTDRLAFLAGYVAARRDFLESVATATGLRIAVVDELPGGVEAISQPIAPATKQ